MVDIDEIIKFKHIVKKTLTGPSLLNQASTFCKSNRLLKNIGQKNYIMKQIGKMFIILINISLIID